MVTRPGAGTGCLWMKRLSEGLPAAAKSGRWVIWYITAMVFLMVLGFVLNHAIARVPGKTYESPVQIAGLPVVSVGPQARGVVAIGGVATGVIAFGGIAIGGLAVGGLALGGIPLGGLSLGILALGGGALGWWALGGGAVGY